MLGITTGSDTARKPGLGEDRHASPGCYEDAHRHEEPSSARTELSLDSFGTLALAVFPHSETVSDDKCKSDSEDQLREDQIESNYVTHEVCHRSPVSLLTGIQ